jgi:2-polyprenyl-6-hydroxyphenyl methylase/3-demethylubiquinone-9 3-methyltransferase
MIATYEAAVASRFDAIHGRFKTELATDDPRLVGLLACLPPPAGRRILDMGCGKGRFARALRDRGARVVGIDVSPAMLAGADGAGWDRVRGTARRLPFGPSTFDAAIAVEVFEHLSPAAIDAVCGEVHRILRPGATFIVVDKNVYSFSARRRWLPSVAVKWIDERRGLWMYPHRGPVRERWFRPGGLRRRLERWFADVRVSYLLSGPEAGRFPFQQVPAARLFAAWIARKAGGLA